MVKVSKGLSTDYQDRYPQLTKAHKKEARYIATKNKDAFSWAGDKLIYKVGQAIKSILGKSDYQAMKKEVKSEVLETFKGKGYDDKKLGKLIDFQIDLYVKLNQFRKTNPKATKEEEYEFVKDFAKKQNVGPAHTEALLKTIEDRLESQY